MYRSTTASHNGRSFAVRSGHHDAKRSRFGLYRGSAQNRSRPHLLRNRPTSLVHPDIVRREKFGWYTASSQELMREKYDLIDHYLSNEFITKCGIFDSGAVEAIRKRYGEPGFTIAQPYDVDILSIILTLGIFVDEFGVDVVS